MLKTLRNRLIFSHVLPLLVVVPLTGIALIYILETQILYPELTKQLLGDAKYVAEAARFRITLWEEPAEAYDFLIQVNPNSSARAMLLDTASRLVASTDLADQARIGQVIAKPIA
jgi:hypothetical protein